MNKSVLDKWIILNQTDFPKWAKAILKWRKSDYSDLSNDLIIRLYEMLESGKLKKSHLNTPYVYQVMRNMMLNKWRKNPKEKSVDFSEIGNEFRGSCDIVIGNEVCTINIGKEDHYHEYFFTFYQLELDRMGYTYDQILKLSRISSGIMELPPDKIELYKDYYILRLSMSKIAKKRQLPKSRVHNLILDLNNNLLLKSKDPNQKIRY